MTNRVCNRCGIEKPIGDFPTWKNRGVLKTYSRCRQCRNEVARSPAYRKVKYDYMLRPEYKNANYRKRAKKAHSKKREEKYPEKAKAKQVVQAALRAGRLVRPDRCEACGSRRATEGHHDDYSKPLVVRWLCQPCHLNFHLAQRKGDTSVSRPNPGAE